MPSLTSGLFAVALTSLIATAAVVGCSADGGGIVDTSDPTAPTGSGLPPSSSSGDVPDAGKDASKKDSGPRPEAGVDAGPPPPGVGTPCPTIDAKAFKPCGACGKSTTLCLDDGTGNGTWGVYGACGDELPGGCVPGSTGACGNCGTQVCNTSCGFGSCTVPPAAVCAPGAVEYSNGSCSSASTYRDRTCSASCAWGAFSATCTTPVNELVLNIGAAVGATTSKTITFSTARMGTKLTGACPTGVLGSATNYPYQYVEIHNPSATKPATVTVYASAAPGGPVIDTLMAAYGSPIRPMDDTSRAACRDGVNDQSYSDTALTGNADFSILKAVAIPAGSSVVVYVTSYFQNSSGLTTTGNLNINTKVETL